MRKPCLPPAYPTPHCYPHPHPSYEAVFHAAVQRLPELGSIIKLDLVCDLPMDARNKWVGSTCGLEKVWVRCDLPMDARNKWVGVWVRKGVG